MDPKQLDKSFVGRQYDADLLAELPPGVDPCGERGEFHTFCYRCPKFRSRRCRIIGATAWRTLAGVPWPRTCNGHRRPCETGRCNRVLCVQPPDGEVQALANVTQARYGTKSTPASLDRCQKRTIVTRISAHSTKTSPKASPGRCSPKNRHDHRTFRRS